MEQARGIHAEYFRSPPSGLHISTAPIRGLMEQAFARQRAQGTAAQVLENAEFQDSVHDREASLGQFFTPPEVATRMARLVQRDADHAIQILDPGAGPGVLSWALGCHLLQAGFIKKLHLDLYEIDSKLASLADRNVAALSDRAGEVGVDLTYNVNPQDFLRAKWSEGAPLNTEPQKYDIVIMNPPYYKIRKDSDYSIMAGELIHGQPNVYALFLVLAARLLKEGGELIAIAPRSWLSGSYFRNLRNEILNHLDLTDVCTFQSRSETFRHQKVLQETLIFRGVRSRRRNRPDVRVEVVTLNGGAEANHTFQVPWATMAPKGVANTVRIPESIEQLAALRELDSVPTKLDDLGLRVSTGPVVAFRSKELMLDESSKRDSCALVWLDNVRRGRVEWPGPRADRNPRRIAREAKGRKLLIEGEEMVLVRRFSAKEDRHRVVAAHLREGELGDLVGVENHLNVIRGFAGRRENKLAAALTQFLNSELVDQYLRACSGTTQINAADLRALPVPPAEVLIGQWSS